MTTPSFSISFEFGPPRVPYTAVVREDEATDGTLLFLAEIPELPGCQAHGLTPDEALRNVEEAAELYLEVAGAAPIAPATGGATTTSGTSMLGPSVGALPVDDSDLDVTLELVA